MHVHCVKRPPKHIHIHVYMYMQYMYMCMLLPAIYALTHTYACTHFHSQNIWIKYSAIGFLLSAAGQLDEVDVQCYILPRLLPFLKYPIIQLTDLGVLLSSLREPVPRGVLDFIIKHQNIREIYEWWVYIVRAEVYMYICCMLAEFLMEFYQIMHVHVAGNFTGCAILPLLAIHSIFLL